MLTGIVIALNSAKLIFQIKSGEVWSLEGSMAEHLSAQTFS